MRSPESAQAKADANTQANHPVKTEPKGRLLKGPDGFVYVWTEALAKQPGFESFTGEMDAGGFAKVAPAPKE